MIAQRGGAAPLGIARFVAEHVVRAYYAVLAILGLQPHRLREDDIAITHTAAAYVG